MLTASPSHAVGDAGGFSRPSRIAASRGLRPMSDARSPSKTMHSPAGRPRPRSRTRSSIASRVSSESHTIWKGLLPSSMPLASL